MSRVQLALNVNVNDEAVACYTKLFGTEPAKRRPGYANFAISEPPLKLVLLENPGQGGSLNPDEGTLGVLGRCGDQEARSPGAQPVGSLVAGSSGMTSMEAAVSR